MAILTLVEFEDSSLPYDEELVGLMAICIRPGNMICGWYKPQVAAKIMERLEEIFEQMEGLIEDKKCTSFNEAAQSVADNFDDYCSEADASICDDMKNTLIELSGRENLDSTIAFAMTAEAEPGW